MLLIQNNLQSIYFPTALKFLVLKKKSEGKKDSKKDMSTGTTGFLGFTPASKKSSEECDSQSSDLGFPDVSSQSTYFSFR